MIDDKSSQNGINSLKNIGKSGIGNLAQYSGKATLALSSPHAVKVFLEIPNLEPEAFTAGKKRYQKYLQGLMEKYGFDSKSIARPGSGFLTISTESDEIVCIGAIRHISNTIGYIAAISPALGKGTIPLSDALPLVISQVESRINHLLKPGSSTSLEIWCRKSIDELGDIGVNGICVSPEKPEHVIVSLAVSEKETVVCDVDNFPVEQLKDVDSGADLDGSEIASLWPDIEGIKAAIWIKDSQNRLIAFGFSDKKMLNKTARQKIEKYVDSAAEADIDFIVNSFEKLKADFKKMVKAERAAAVTETAVTVNHVINNPLTAILGNTQLLLMNKDKLPKETVAKLQTIEKSAIQIRETTAELMTIIEPVRKHYASGLEMIDIEKSKKKSPEDK
jgi:hypothetical protein